MSKENAAGQTPAQETENTALLPDMQITVRPIEQQGNLLGFASVKIGPITMDNFKIVEGKDGLFVGMPSRPDKNSDTGYRNTVWIDKDSKEAFGEKILGEYYLAVEQAQSRPAPEKPRIDEQMKAAKRQADRDNAARPAPAKPDKAKAAR